MRECVCTVRLEINIEQYKQKMTQTYYTGDVVVLYLESADSKRPSVILIGLQDQDRVFFFFHMQKLISLPCYFSIRIRELIYFRNMADFSVFPSYLRFFFFLLTVFLALTQLHRADRFTRVSC